MDAAATVEVTVVLRPRAGAAEADQALDPRRSERRYLSRDELGALRGADASDVTLVSSFAEAEGLQVLEADAPARRVVLSGPAPRIGAAFGVDLVVFEHPSSGTHLGHEGPVRVPAELAPVVVAVLGLDQRPQASTRLVRAVAPARSYSPPEVARLYGYPTAAGAPTAPGAPALDGSGQCIAIVELGGGYVTADLQAYFSGLGLAAPEVQAVPVDGGANAPTGSPSGPDAEVMLDVEVTGSIAGKALIAVYFAPNTDRGFVDAISAAVHDNLRHPSVISVSWGGPEQSYTASARAAFEAVLADAALVGITVLVAAGDQGSSDGVPGGLAHVDYPASSPHAVGCGGTTMEASGSSAASRVIASEVVWDDQPQDGATGGGVSSVFPVPPWQAAAGVPPSANPGAGPGRGVPDVAGNADPNTGYAVRVDGQDTVVGGTSAVAPLWASLVALVNQELASQSPPGAPVGFLCTQLYPGAHGPGLHGRACRDITQGSNGAYAAGPGWDACTGWGSPDGRGLLSGITGA
ncbi:MAG: S53 family peptidase [Acidimicrobiales bacterium]